MTQTKKGVPEGQEYMRGWLHEHFEIKKKKVLKNYDSPDPERRNKFLRTTVNFELRIKKTLAAVFILNGLTDGTLMTEAGSKIPYIHMFSTQFPSSLWA